MMDRIAPSPTGTPHTSRTAVAAFVLLAVSLVAGVYLLASLASRLAEGWSNRPAPALAPSPVPTPLPTWPRIGAATATRIPRRTPTAVSTPEPAGQCPDALRDGGFEVGDSWRIVSTAYSAGYVNRPAAYVDDPVHSGERALRLGIPDGPDVYSYSAAEQAVTIPADTTSARLSLWLYAVSADTAGDGQYVLLLREGHDGYDTLLWQLENTNGWQRHEFSLDAYRGQTVVVHFEVHNDGDGALTALYIDDVSLSICR